MQAPSSPSSERWRLHELTTAFGTEPTWQQRRILLKAAGVSPTPLQEKWLRATLPDGTEAKRKLATGGEQAGKSFVTAMEAFSRVFHSRLIWIVCPDYEQGRREMEYLEQFGNATGLLQQSIMPKNPAPLRLYFKTGCVIKTVSAQDERKIAGEAPDAVLMVEGGQQSEQSFLRCLGRTAPRDAVLAINGTLEGSTNWFARLYKSWGAPNLDGAFGINMPSWSNTHLYPKGRADKKLTDREKLMPAAQFKERFEGIPTAPTGLVHSDFDPIRHVRPIRLAAEPDERVPGDPTIYLPPETPLTVAIDWGWAHHYVVLFTACVQERVYIVAEIAETGLNDLQMIQLAQHHPLWRNVRDGVIDVGTRQHHGGDTTTQQLWVRETGLTLRSKKVDVIPGIKLVSLFLMTNPMTQEPRLRLDPSCTRLIYEWGEGYRRVTDRHGAVVEETPRDINNDADKAVVYLLNDKFPGFLQRSKKALPRQVASWEKLRQSWRGPRAPLAVP